MHEAPDDLPVVWLNPAKMLQLQLEALVNSKAVGKLDYYQEGEFWVRIGIDGVPLWHSHVVAATLSICGELVDLPEHSPRRHAVVALFRGYDSVANLKSVLKHTKMDVALGGLNGLVVTVFLQRYTVHIFVEGDHMLVYKICGKDGPTSTNPDRSPCPYCDADAPECLNYNPEARPYTKAPSSLLQTVPIEQHAVDMAHGAVNVLYTVE